MAVMTTESSMARNEMLAEYVENARLRWKVDVEGNPGAGISANLLK
jgi:hypothetical protein